VTTTEARTKKDDLFVYAANELPVDIQAAIARSRTTAEYANLDKDEKIEIS
jgi:hypothetical protein